MNRRELLQTALGGTMATALVGLNCRDLVTLAVDRQRLFELAGTFGSRDTAVAESGLDATPEDACELVTAGYELALVGSALMRDREPGETLASFIRAGRDFRRRSTCASA